MAEEQVEAQAQTGESPTVPEVETQTEDPKAELESLLEQLNCSALITRVIRTKLIPIGLWIGMSCCIIDEF